MQLVLMKSPRRLHLGLYCILDILGNLGYQGSSKENRASWRDLVISSSEASDLEDCITSCIRALSSMTENTNVSDSTLAYQATAVFLWTISLPLYCLNAFYRYIIFLTEKMLIHTNQKQYMILTWQWLPVSFLFILYAYLLNYLWFI